MKLHYRIVIPFALVAVFATALSAFVALSVASRALEARVQTQISSTATLISQSDFALNPTILHSVKAIAGADVITFDRSGSILASTIDAAANAELVRAVTSAPTVARALAGSNPAVEQLSCGVPCDVAFRRVAARPEIVVAVVAEKQELMATTRAVTRAIVIAALISLAVMLIVSQLVARRVTAPLDALVRFVGTVSPGGAQRAAVSRDEVGRLGQAFNDMLDRLAQSRQALVRSEKLALTGLIAARVAHDIRNPLSSIKMQTQLLAAKLRGADDATRQGVEAILHDVVQVEAVIRELLELARPGELTLRPTALNAVAGEVLVQLAPQLTHRRIRVDERLDPGDPQVPLDADRFKQVLLNVINNAADAMPAGGTLRVETVVEAGGHMIRLEVCDDGEGIDPAVKERVFDPFVSTKRDGVGLGLVNAKAVVDSHGGQIELTSIAPRGTRATIRLPAADRTHG